MELQARDREILAFISHVKVVTIKIIHDAFFRKTARSTEACRRRLQKLTQAGYLQSFTDGFGREHLYRLSPRESREIEDEELTLARFYVALKRLEIPILKSDFYSKFGPTTMGLIALVRIHEENTLLLVQSNRIKAFPTKKIDQCFFKEEYREQVNDCLREYEALTIDKVTFVSLSDFQVPISLNVKPIRIGADITDLTPLIGPHAPLV